jgi:hypothetical protein
LPEGRAGHTLNAALDIPVPYGVIPTHIHTELFLQLCEQPKEGIDGAAGWCLNEIIHPHHEETILLPAATCSQGMPMGCPCGQKSIHSTQEAANFIQFERATHPKDPQSR